MQNENYEGLLNQFKLIFVKKETFKQKKLSCTKHGKKNPKWWDKATQKMGIGRKLGGDGQECIGK